MSELDELARAASGSHSSASSEVVRELRTANAHLKSIKGWVSFLGWLVLLSLIVYVLGLILTMLDAMAHHAH